MRLVCAAGLLSIGKAPVQRALRCAGPGRSAGSDKRGDAAMIDNAIFALCLLAAISAECILVMVILTVAAGVLTLAREAMQR